MKAEAEASVSGSASIPQQPEAPCTLASDLRAIVTAKVIQGQVSPQPAPHNPPRLPSEILAMSPVGGAFRSARRVCFGVGGGRLCGLTRRGVVPNQTVDNSCSLRCVHGVLRVLLLLLLLNATL